MSTHFEQKSTELRQLVENLAGQRLPGERELAKLLQLSRPHVRALLTTLEADGLVQRRQGSGTYAVDRHAQGLNTVALLIDEQLKLGDDPFFSLLLEHLQAALQAEHIRCVIERISPLSTPPSLQDGAITLGQAGESILAHPRSEHPPIVGLFLNTQIQPNAHASLFQLADHEAGKVAASYLLDKHCEALLFIGKQDIIASRERLMGVESVANAVGMPIHFVSCSLNYVSGLKLGREVVLPECDGPLGLIAANDWLALGLQAGLSSGIIGIPQKISEVHIVSFDGLSMMDDASIGIASLAVPLSTIAIDAVAELRRLHQSPVPVGRVVRYPLSWRTKKD